MPAFDDFLKAFPDYQGTGRIDALRASEYRRLDAQHHVYLDYTGGALHAESQVREHMALLNTRVLGNPHSVSLTSSGMTDLVERARRAVLTWFNAEAGYTAIFTQNATAALKHVGESYPFGPHGRYLLSMDNHNSVNGIREFAAARGAAVSYVPLTTPDLRIDRDRLRELLEEASTSANNLFAFPAQSNFSGVKHPLEIVEDAHQLADGTCSSMPRHSCLPVAWI